MTSLTNCKNPSNNLFQENGSESRLWTVEKIDQLKQRKARTETLKRLSEQSSEVVSIFKVASRNYINIFLFHKGSLKI
jgi:hypothetical protein